MEKQTELKKSILELRKKDYTYNMIVEKLNCSKSTVSYYCKNLPKTKTSLNINKDDEDKIISLRKENKTYEEIKKITNISYDKIVKISKSNNLGKGKICRSKINFSEDEIININKMYQEIKSIRKLSNILEISKDTLRKFLIIETKKKDPTERKKDIVQNVINWRKRTKIKLVEYKGGKCENCGYDKVIRNMTFHHIDPNKKDFAISGKSYSFDKLKNELDKCILLCANCHGEVHDEIEEKNYSEIVNNIINKK